MSIEHSVERFFYYFTMCSHPSITETDPYDFENLLNAVVVLNERMGTNPKMGRLETFNTARAIRNYFQHHDDVPTTYRLIANGAKGVPSFAYRDITKICLIKVDVVDRAYKEYIARRKSGPAPALVKLPHYASCYDLAPSIFNLAVDVHEHLMKIGYDPSDMYHAEYQKCYQHDVQNNIPLRVSGGIIAHAGSMSRLIEVLYEASAPASKI